MKKLIYLIFMVPLFGISQIQHIDSIQIKTIGTVRSALTTIASLTEKQFDGQTFYYLVYVNFDGTGGTMEIKFAGGQAVMDELYKSLMDAISKPQGRKIFFKLGDQLVSIEVKKDFKQKYLDISADAGEFKLDQ
jgi:hypothetical protein